ncbi:unnamed protein product [Pneumocystis jirovecii]|uniref:Sphingolipid delta(4)-desaturase n=2 Tax=Pneumocystis jirovecii TaxID=42068 RepID=L0PDY1_PNEJI|nr:uncharacterized protein T551_00997 [Pneumocystis jirovecii RU7]KTW31736.1 hypothetical protein T551_00997 [Pneumocystis jirovecii RU7]CCJ30299.1 unnamed protein product [Pneumocystis jirovecii]
MTIKEIDKKPVLNDFLWTYQEEPHKTRRHEIIKTHPEVIKLCGHEPLTKYIIFFVVIFQLVSAYLLRNEKWLSIKFFLYAYIFGATANQNIFLAIHELSHNLVFKQPKLNQYFSIFANLPIGVPYSASFKPYHLLHHKYLGEDGTDADLPTKLEAVLLNNVLGKAFFCTFQLFFYAIRPVFIKRLPFTFLHIINLLFQLLFNIILIRLVGTGAFFYLILSSFLAGSLHPCAGHFIAEHFSLVKDKNDAIDTFSYYGILNVLTYNVGYHNEHHDFPFIPWTRLPKLNSIANEFYRNLPYHTSWIYVLWQFITDDRVGLWCRIKRKKGLIRKSQKK